MTPEHAPSSGGKPGLNPAALSVFQRMAFDEARAAASAECGKPVSTQGWCTPVEKKPATEARPCL